MSFPHSAPGSVEIPAEKLPQPQTRTATLRIYLAAIALLSAAAELTIHDARDMFGAAAYFAGTAVTRAAMISARISHLIPLATGTALIVAAAYQLTPVKSTCLRHCRDPLSFAAEHLAAGWRGALRLGVHHGVFCA